MRDHDDAATRRTEHADEQILATGSATGVGRDLLRSLPPHAVVAYRGEPTASERAMLSWPMSDAERAEFGSSLQAVAGRLRDMTPQDMEALLDKLERETDDLDLIEVRAEDPGSQDLPEELPTASPTRPQETGVNGHRPNSRPVPARR